MEKLKSLNVYCLLFWAIAFFYAFFVARFGFETWDTGYIPSYSWRIVNGQNAYADFVYKAPPSTLYFQVIWMKILPVSGQFFYIKTANYLMFALQGFLIVSSFYNFYGNRIKFNKWSVMIVGFIISLLNFPGYPWPTTDGLFFAAIAFYILSLKPAPTLLQLFLVSFFSIISALTKQSFYLIPLGFLTAVWLLHGIRKAFYFFSFTVLFILLFLGWINSISSLAAFSEQTTGQTHFKDLFYTGFLYYFWIYKYKPVIFPLIAVSGFLLFYFPKKKRKSLKNYAINIALILLAIAVLLCLFPEFLLASRITFLACALLLAIRLIYEKNSLKLYAPIALALLIAWSCSISMGYPYPILFATGLILCVIVLSGEEINTIRSPKIPLILGSILCILAFSYNYKPYRDHQFPELNHSLGDISPKLRYLRTNKKTKEKLLELKSLIQQYGNQYIVAPNFPMTHYIFDTQSVLPADWISNFEINRNPGVILTIAAKKENFVFLEKSFLEGEELQFKKPEDFSVIAVYIHQNFMKIDETAHFIIYNTQEKEAPIPVIERKPVH